MIHQNGIEVYLQAGGRKPPVPRKPLAELEVAPVDDNDSGYKRCFIPLIDGEFEVVLKVPHDFDMHGASALRFSIAIGANEDVSRAEEWHTKLVSRWRLIRHYHHSELPKADVLTSGNEMIFKMVECRDIDKFMGESRDHRRDVLKANELQANELDRVVLTNSGYWQAVNQGSVSVFLQLGHVEWKQDGNSRARSAVGTRHSFRRYGAGTFKALDGLCGKKMMFEFLPIWQGAYFDDIEGAITAKRSAAAEMKAGPLPHNTSCSASQLASGPVSSRQEIQTSPPAETLPPQVPQVLQHISTSIVPPAGRNYLADASTAKSCARYKRKVPQVCNCSEGNCEQTAKLPRASTDGVGSRVRRLATTDKVDQPMTSERLANQCTECTGLKKAPRGMKIGWRGRTSSWMYVDKRAVDEEPPLQSASDEPGLRAEPETLGSVRPTTTSGSPQQPLRTTEMSVFPSPAAVVNGIDPECEDDAASDDRTDIQQVTCYTPVADLTGKHGNGDGVDAESDLQNEHDESISLAPPSLFPSQKGNGRATTPSTRVEIDLTADDENEPSIKHEPGVRQIKRSASVFDVGNAESDLRDRLIEIQLQAKRIKLDKAELRVERQKFEIERRLRRMREGRSIANEVIKVENDPKVEVID